MVRAVVKQTQIWVSAKENTYLTENFHFWSFDLKKMQIWQFLRKIVLMLETVRARVKQEKCWDRPRDCCLNVIFPYKFSAFGCYYMV